MITPAPIDPPEIEAELWCDVTGRDGWDIGANTGQSLTHMNGRFATVTAFEPAEECHPYLQPFVDAGVRLMRCAVSDTDGDIQLAALPDKISTGQLVSPGTHGMEWDPDVPAAVARTVPARTVDRLAVELGPPDFLKIDVEGHEGRVLAGAGRVLARHRPDLLIEFHTPQLYESCRRSLQDSGYQIRVVRHPHYPPGARMWHQHGWLKATHPTRHG